MISKGQRPQQHELRNGRARTPHSTMAPSMRARGARRERLRATALGPWGLRGRLLVRAGPSASAKATQSWPPRRGGYFVGLRAPCNRRAVLRAGCAAWCVRFVNVGPLGPRSRFGVFALFCSLRETYICELGRSLQLPSRVPAAEPSSPESSGIGGAFWDKNNHLLRG